MKKAVVVSFNGTENAGGVERVSQYVLNALEGLFKTEIFKKADFNLPKIDFFVQGILMNLRLVFSRPDFVVSNSWQSYRYPADVSFSHGTTEGYCRKIGSFRRFSSAGLMAHMEKKAAESAKKIIAVSGHVKDELVSIYGINPDKIFVLPNCVDDKKFVPKKDAESRNEKIILFSGRLEHRKGLRALQEFSDFIEKQDGWKLHIAANTNQNEDLLQKNKNTKLFFGLASDEMAEFYRSGDILYFPSLYEGFSMATLEALSCGIPVIGTDYVVSEELSKYEFCRNCGDFISNPQMILENAEYLYEHWHDRKDFIHEEIRKDFGIQQWKEKFLTAAFHD